jgi:hypothetical protein
MLYPEMFAEVLGAHDKLTEWVGAAVPLPVSDSVVEEGWALLVKVNVATADPETLGLNVIVNGTLWPAGMVTGKESPLITKTELVEVAPVTVTLPPLACNVPEAVPLVPTTTLPSPRVLGETPS